MVDFEKAATDEFEDQFLAVLAGSLFHFSRNVYKKFNQLAWLASIWRNKIPLFG